MNTQTNSAINGLLKKQETYFVGAALPAMFIFGFFDGGLSVALAYGANWLHKEYNGLK